MEMIEEETKNGIADKIAYLSECALEYAYLLLPIIYIMWHLLFKSMPSWEMLLFWILMGTICHYAHHAWRNRIIDDDIIDFENTNGHNNGTPYRQLSLWATIRQMERWELMHWVSILGFLGLTWWAMKNGLMLLFPSSIEADIFIYVFSTIITITLLWLVLMISSRRNIIGFIVFYVIFDAMSAFSFNFVHFYDNISKTQRLDSDMKACITYKDKRSSMITKIAGSVEMAYNNREAEIKKNTTSINKRIADIDKEIGKQQNNQNKYDRGTYDYNLCTKRINNYEKQKEKLIAQKDISNEYAGPNANATQMTSLMDTLLHLCHEYELAKSPRDFQKLNVTKMLVVRLESKMEDMLRKALEKKMCSEYQTVNDTVVYLLEKIQRTEGDHFASLKSLLTTLEGFFNPQIKIEQDELIKKKAHGNKVLVNLYCDEASFERRLLLLAISLSVLIDILPLTLGIFVAMIKRKWKNT